MKVRESEKRLFLSFQEKSEQRIGAKVTHEIFYQLSSPSQPPTPSFLSFDSEIFTPPPLLLFLPLPRPYHFFLSKVEKALSNPSPIGISHPIFAVEGEEEGGGNERFLVSPL